MIISQIGGGTGNQLFQYAAGRRLAHKLNTELKLNVTNNYQDKLRPYSLNLFNVKENFATAEEIQRLKNLRQGTSIGIERDTAAYKFQPEVLDYPDDVWLHGAWENEKYFADIADILRHEFTLKNPLSESAQRWKEKILSCECSVSMHFRHGDFMYHNADIFALVPLEYYYECINQLSQQQKNFTVFVFSNNLKWCKENLQLGVPTEFVEGDGLQDVEELYLMSLCKQHVQLVGRVAQSKSRQKSFRPDSVFHCRHGKNLPQFFGGAQRKFFAPNRQMDKSSLRPQQTTRPKTAPVAFSFACREQ